MFDSFRLEVKIGSVFPKYAPIEEISPFFYKWYNKTQLKRFLWKFKVEFSLFVRGSNSEFEIVPVSGLQQTFLCRYLKMTDVFISSVTSKVSLYNSLHDVIIRGKTYSKLLGKKTWFSVNAKKLNYFPKNPGGGLMVKSASTPKKNRHLQHGEVILFWKK